MRYYLSENVLSPFKTSWLMHFKEVILLHCRNPTEYKVICEQNSDYFFHVKAGGTDGYLSASKSCSITMLSSPIHRAVFSDRIDRLSRHKVRTNISPDKDKRPPYHSLNSPPERDHLKFLRWLRHTSHLMFLVIPRIWLEHLISCKTTWRAGKLPFFILMETIEGPLELLM
jgi:hypothetical protein